MLWIRPPLSYLLPAPYQLHHHHRQELRRSRTACLWQGLHASVPTLPTILIALPPRCGKGPMGNILLCFYLCLHSSQETQVSCTITQPLYFNPPSVFSSDPISLSKLWNFFTAPLWNWKIVFSKILKSSASSLKVPLASHSHRTGSPPEDTMPLQPSQEDSFPLQPSPMGPVVGEWLPLLWVAIF